MPAPAQLTKARLAALKLGERQRDAKVRGLFAERGAKGWSLKIQADLHVKGQPVRTVRQTLGQWSDLTAIDLEAVRAEAQGLISTIKRGIDPRAPERAGVLTVGKMWAAYAADLAQRQCEPRTIEDFERVLKVYLPAFGSRAVAEVKPSELRAEHTRLTTAHGPVAANKAMRAFRTAFNLASKQADPDEVDALNRNPVGGVTLHTERRREAVIQPGDLADWYERLQKIPNPLRRLMHEIGLFSGLRPGSLMTLEKAWYAPTSRAIVIPRAAMKSRRDFALPLSAHMVRLVERALVLSNEIASGSPWLFPTRTNDGREVVATRVIRERTMPSETGHILRHTHATLAKAAGVDDMLASLLSDHKVAGIRGVYVHESALFAQLLAAQEKVTAHLLSLIRQ